MKIRNLIPGILCILLAAGAALAQPGDCRGDRGPGDRGDRLERMTERLDLSADQVEAIRAIQDKSREKGLETRKEILRLENELEGVLLRDDPDSGKAAELVRRIGALRTEQQVRRMETRLAVRAQLTEEQQDKLAVQGPRKGRGQGRGGDCAPGCREKGPRSGHGRGRR
jgi:Spy/CpxP family protein refolding chaperone